MSEEAISGGTEDVVLTCEAREGLENLLSDFKDVFENPIPSHIRALLEYVQSLAKMD